MQPDAEPIENTKNQSLLQQLSQLSDDLAYLSPHEFLLKLPDKICMILNVDSCILWILNEKEQKFQVGYASQEVDDEYKQIELDDQFQRLKTPIIGNELLHLLSKN